MALIFLWPAAQHGHHHLAPADQLDATEAMPLARPRSSPCDQTITALENDRLTCLVARTSGRPD
jgi:hypothetical protein